MRELADCDDDFQYHDLARRTELLAAALGDEGHGELAYRALVLFARHAGDDGKRTPLQRDAAMDHLQRLATRHAPRRARRPRLRGRHRVEPRGDAGAAAPREQRRADAVPRRRARDRAEPARPDPRHPDRDGRGRAARAAARVRERRAAPRCAPRRASPASCRARARWRPLAALLEGREASLRQEAAKALVRIGDARAIDVLVRAPRERGRRTCRTSPPSASAPRATRARPRRCSPRCAAPSVGGATTSRRSWCAPSAGSGAPEAAGDLAALLAPPRPALSRRLARAQARGRRRARPRPRRRGARRPRRSRPRPRPAAPPRRPERPRTPRRRDPLSCAHLTPPRRTPRRALRGVAASGAKGAARSEPQASGAPCAGRPDSRRHSRARKAGLLASRGARPRHRLRGAAARAGRVRRGRRVRVPGRHARAARRAARPRGAARAGRGARRRARRGRAAAPHGRPRRARGARGARRSPPPLGEATGLPVDTFDERWTTREAERSLREQGLVGRRGQEAAARSSTASRRRCILQAYLARPARAAAPEPEVR